MRSRPKRATASWRMARRSSVAARFDGEDGLVNIVDQEAGASIVDQLRHRPPTGGHYRRPAGHGFDDAEAEGLLEVDEMEESVSPTEEGVAALAATGPM